MIVTQFVGYLFLLSASISSSISMNFQKLAQHEIHFVDPRTRLQRRPTPLKSPVYCRPLFLLAIGLSFAASTMDFLALTWLPPLTVGIFGAVSIIVNLMVSKIILFEQPDAKEWFAIACVVSGCVLSIVSKVSGDSDTPPPRQLERLSSCVYVVATWVLCQVLYAVLKQNVLPQKVQRVGYPCIAGALGAQNVCMGKYIAWATAEAFRVGHLTVRLDVLLAVLSLCVASVVVHIAWLNMGLAKHDAYYCIIVYQSTWFFFTTLTGIVVYDNMATLTPWSQVTFFLGCFLAMFGVWKISAVHQDSNET